MSFTPTPPPPQQTDDERGVMHIGGARSRRLWDVARWMTVILVIAAVMVALFIRFGATTLWAFGLVAFMLAYMTIMGRWASGDHQRR